MKKILSYSLLSTALLLGSNAIIASSADKLNLSGTYNCTGFDNHDGTFTGTITLKLDAKASDFKHNFGAYAFTLTEGGAGTGVNAYTGEAAAQGDILAIYFQNTDVKDAVGISDRGVGIATVSHDQDSKGNVITTLHKFYYEPTYKRGQDGKKAGGLGEGGHGTETCVKDDK